MYFLQILLTENSSLNSDALIIARFDQIPVSGNQQLHSGIIASITIRNIIFLAIPNDSAWFILEEIQLKIQHALLDALKNLSDIIKEHILLLYTLKFLCLLLSGQVIPDTDLTFVIQNFSLS